jgi:SAM-dependent methyltransferase
MSAAASATLGFAPGVLIAPAVPVIDHEQAKYEKMWAQKQYRDFSPGENTAQTFLEVVRPGPGEHVIDFGCGTGRGSIMLALMGRMKVTMVDFAANCLDDFVQEALVTQPHALEFVQADLRNELPVGAKYGYCTDVMEHLPPEEVHTTLTNILRSAQHVFFQISLQDDAMGALIGEPLHLTVKPYEWWLEELKSLDAVVHWSAEADDHSVACFYVSSWKPVSLLIEHGTVNTEHNEIDANIASAMERGLKMVSPHIRNEEKVVILAGGPSLNDSLEEIKDKIAQGFKLVTTNGAYNWAIEHGLEVKGQIVVDAREFNSRFVQPAMPGCKYFLASQCHPFMFDAVPADQVWLWHSALTEEQCNKLQDIHASMGQVFYPVIGGSTVMLRALPLLFMLGFYQFEIFGFDSCLIGDEHHAYAQEENDKGTILQVSCGDKMFRCNPWMASQAQEFIDLMKAMMPGDIYLEVHGEGLIAEIIKTAASDITEIKET